MFSRPENPPFTFPGPSHVSVGEAMRSASSPLETHSRRSMHDAPDPFRADWAALASAPGIGRGSRLPETFPTTRFGHHPGYSRHYPDSIDPSMHQQRQAKQRVPHGSPRQRFSHEYSFSEPRQFHDPNRRDSMDPGFEPSRAWSLNTANDTIRSAPSRSLRGSPVRGRYGHRRGRRWA